MDRIEILARKYKKHGGKKSRRNQVQKIRKFLAFTGLPPARVNEVGRRQIIRFFKAHSDYSDRTLYDYWLAFKHLYTWLGRAEIPPKPHLKKG